MKTCIYLPLMGAILGLIISASIEVELPTVYRSTLHECHWVELPSGTITDCSKLPDKYHVVYVAPFQ